MRSVGSEFDMAEMMSEWVFTVLGSRSRSPLTLLSHSCCWEQKIQLSYLDFLGWINKNDKITLNALPPRAVRYCTWVIIGWIISEFRRGWGPMLEGRKNRNNISVVCIICIELIQDNLLFD